MKKSSLGDDKIEIPNPSDIASLACSKGTFVEEGKTIVSLVDIDSIECRRKIDTKTVRRNVALLSWLNYEAERAGLNVSRVLQEALMSVLNVKKLFDKIVYSFV